MCGGQLPLAVSAPITADVFAGWKARTFWPIFSQAVLRAYGREKKSGGGEGRELDAGGRGWYRKGRFSKQKKEQQTLLGTKSRYAQRAFGIFFERHRH